MLYGLEVIYLTKTQINQFEQYHLRVLCQMQALPHRTASSAVDMLLGALPVDSADIHKRQLPALATCKTSQVLLAGVPGGFSRGSPVFAHLLIGPSHMS